jgi:short-subunit dehydrogenase
MTERISLITGASSGIGADLARVFAANGHRVALVARRGEELHKLAAEIVAAGGPSAIVIPCDLAADDAGDVIVKALAAESVEVEFLVNNAGFGLVGRAIKLDRNQQLDMIDVNVRALTDLSLRFADSVIRHRGGILNVGSIASFMPGPGMATYYATKAFVLSFTEALNAELTPSGVRVCALCPGPVPSGFQNRAGMQPGMMTTPIDVPAAEVARQGYQGLMNGKRIVLPGLVPKLLPFWVRLTPRAWVLAAIGKSLLGR